MEKNNLGYWIFFLGELKGPYEMWEINLIASKYRDFFIFSGELNIWKKFNVWKHTDSKLKTLKPIINPDIKKIFFLKVKRTLKRNFLKNHH